MLIVYFGDTLASMYAVSVLAAYAATQREPEFRAWIKDGVTPLKRVPPAAPGHARRATVFPSSPSAASLD